MYFDDHAPPHFHAFYAEQEAEIGIGSLGLLAGRLPPRAFAMAVEWAAQHQDELNRNWELLHTSQLPLPIPPLE